MEESQIVCPLFQSGDKQNISFYHPISVLSKFHEIILYLQIYPSCNMFFDWRSSATNLTQYISETLDEQGQMDDGLFSLYFHFMI